LGGLYFLVWNA